MFEDDYVGKDDMGLMQSFFGLHGYVHVLFPNLRYDDFRKFCARTGAAYEEGVPTMFQPEGSSGSMAAIFGGAESQIGCEFVWSVKLACIVGGMHEMPAADITLASPEAMVPRPVKGEMVEWNSNEGVSPGLHFCDYYFSRILWAAEGPASS